MADIKSTIRITELSQARDDHGIGINGKRMFSEWYYFVEVEFQVSGAGQSITHRMSLPLEEWQYKAIIEGRVEAHKLFGEQVAETMKALETVINRVRGQTRGTPCPTIESGGSES